MASAIERHLQVATGEGEGIGAGMLDFYASRGFQPAWSAEGRLTDAAAAIVGQMQAAASQGLPSASYAIPQAVDTTPIGWARHDLLMSRAVVRYAEHRARGYLDRSGLGKEYQQRLKSVSAPADLLARLAAAVDPVAELAAMDPDTDDFRRLLAGFAQLQQVVAAGGWPAITPGPTLRPGMIDLRVPALRRTLMARGDLQDEPGSAGTLDSPVFDDALVDAVRHFQYRHGLQVDGAVGTETARALNVPAAARLHQMALNLDRRRWLPDYPAGRHFVVNLAAYEVVLMEGARTVFSTAAVIGSRRHETPEFSADMTYVVLNPYWNVPASIATKEILPRLQEDPDYLTRKRMQLFAPGSDRPIDPSYIDWSTVQHMPLRVRQDTGSGNALGLVKFMLPNRFNIYLHDTNEKHLFSRSTRAFSHGCVRLADPVGLAHTLLAPQTGWTREDLLALMDGERQRIVTLGEPIPVRIVYHTAWIDAAGVYHFRPDIYGRDAKLVPGA